MCNTSYYSATITTVAETLTRVDHYCFDNNGNDQITNYYVLIITSGIHLLFKISWYISELRCRYIDKTTNLHIWPSFEGYLQHLNRWLIFYSLICDQNMRQKMCFCANISRPISFRLCYNLEPIFFSSYRYLPFQLVVSQGCH